MWSLNQTLQYTAWFVALIEVILALYVMYLNPRRTVNLHVVFMLVITAVFTFGLGSLTGAENDAQSRLPMTLIAASFTSRLGLYGLVTITLFKAGWLRKRQFGWLRSLIEFSSGLPILATLIDAWQQTNIYLTYINPAIYARGFASPTRFLEGSLAGAWHWFVFGGLGIALLLILSYLILFDRNLSTRQRRLAVWMLGLGAVNWLPGTLFTSDQMFLWSALFASSATMVTFAFIAFQEWLPEQGADLGRGYVRQGRRTSLAARLTILLLIVTLPLLAAMAAFLTEQARSELENDAVSSLAASSRAASEAIEVFLTANSRMLKTLTQDDDIYGMNPAEQRPILQKLVSVYPYVNLAAVLNRSGVTITRSDGGPTSDYHTASWFQAAISGRPVTYQVLTNPDTGVAALVLSSPVRNEKDQIIGVAFATFELQELSRLVQQTAFTRTGKVFLVDDRDYILVHSDRTVKSGTYYHGYPAIALLRSGTVGSMQFTDENGLAWRAHSNLLSNSWGLIVQQDENSLFAPIRNFQLLGFIVLIVGAGSLLLFTWSAIRSGLRPVRTLTNTAAAITQGDIARLAPVESADELGLLAEAFNAMTAQMRDLITGLETRVNERTRDLERRALQLQVTAEVAREAAAIRETEQLLSGVTRLISERLGHYHVGIFFIEGEQEGETSGNQNAYAVLKAANSEGGQQMLVRGHRLRVGQVGIVGFVAASGQPRIALDVGRDAVFFNNPDLPYTRSEVALPLKLQNRVIGVLDVQSRKPSAFNEEDLAILQILADQVTLAIENARLINESQRALQELENLYGQQVERGWRRRLGHQPMIYHLDAQGVHAGDEKGNGRLPAAGDEGLLSVPIELRGRRLGMLRLRRAEEMSDWRPQEKDLVEQVLGQVAQSLENARLLEEIQNRARQEEQINQIVSQAQSSLNLETVMRTAVQELAQTLNISRIRLRLGPEASRPADSASHIADVEAAPDGNETDPTGEQA